MENWIVYSAPVDEFDFDRVARTMLALNWRWMNSDAPPTSEMIRENVRHLQNRLGSSMVRPDGVSYQIDEISSGGIVVKRRDGQVIVAFECTSSSGQNTYREAKRAWLQTRGNLLRQEEQNPDAKVEKEGQGKLMGGSTLAALQRLIRTLRRM
jgi:hypothetical protein